jgi:hypothetical protein
MLMVEKTTTRTAISIIAIALFSMCAWRVSGAQPKHPRMVAKFPGASLKWVHIAEPEFQRKGLNLKHYMVSVVDHKDTVDVFLTSVDTPVSQEVRGSSGTYPAFDVEISKAGDKIMRSYYVR